MENKHDKPLSPCLQSSFMLSSLLTGEVMQSPLHSEPCLMHTELRSSRQPTGLPAGLLLWTWMPSRKEGGYQLAAVGFFLFVLFFYVHHHFVIVFISSFIFLKALRVQFGNQTVIKAPSHKQMRFLSNKTHHYLIPRSWENRSFSSCF